MKPLYKFRLYLFLSLTFLSACSSGFKLGNYDDPYENVNRKSHEFNKVIDKNLLKPSSEVYAGVLGKKPTMAISNFSKNWGLPKDFVNYTLQGDIPNVSKTTGKFLVNSTLGVVGIFDYVDRGVACTCVVCADFRGCSLLAVACSRALTRCLCFLYCPQLLTVRG